MANVRIGGGAPPNYAYEPEDAELAALYAREYRLLECIAEVEGGATSYRDADGLSIMYRSLREYNEQLGRIRVEIQDKLAERAGAPSHPFRRSVTLWP